ncbi:MAG: ABC transporter ATP-binding protein [Nanoarchaeota archaeon]
MLKLKNISKKFGGVKASDNCSFNIQKNKITALIGPNGSGKTTIFNIISRVVKQDKGEIILDKDEITHFSPVKMSNMGISRLFQQARLFENLTIRENLLLAINTQDTYFWKNFLNLNKLKKNEYSQINDILKLVYLEDHQHKLGRNLSYGQKRLVGIARCILSPHKLLMLDEPVAGVNPKIRKEIAKILLDLKKGGETVFLIEHDMEFVLNIADHVIVMDEGKIIAEGTPKKIKSNPKVLEAYLGE